MSEITDLVMPVLQRLQADVAELKRDMSTVKATLAEYRGEFEDIKIYTAYEVGLGTQNQVDMSAIKKSIKAVEQRLTALETTR